MVLGRQFKDGLISPPVENLYEKYNLECHTYFYRYWRQNKMLRTHPPKKYFLYDLYK